jgi:predicted choloylglycine hydrolase
MMNKDPLTKLSNETIERRLLNHMLLTEKEQWETIRIFCSVELEKAISRYDKAAPQILDTFSKLKEELEAATTYIEENEVIHLKYKKNTPTVIQYQGRRYVLDDRN